MPDFLVTEADRHIASVDPSVDILSIPYEHTSSYRLGSAMGPKAILEASQFVEYFDEELGIETIRHVGINTLHECQLNDKVNQEAMEAIEGYVEDCLQSNNFPVVLGAEHTITLPVFSVLNRKVENLSILQLDAHSDLRQSYEGNRLSHASVMARIRELNPKIAQLGIRALSVEEAQLIETDPNIETVFAHQIQDEHDYSSRLLNHLTENVYITIDADGFDPSIIPGTGTPEPGGLMWYETLKFLRRVFEEKNVVGFDIVECAPRPNEIISEFTLAKLVYKLIGYRYLNKLS